MRKTQTLLPKYLNVSRGKILEKQSTHFTHACLTSAKQHIKL